jgi:aryl-alcohol dehydrogenase-like predicted oxidoreductase
MYLDQALMMKNQSFDGKLDSILQAAVHYEIGVFTSVPLMQGKLLSPGVMPEFGDLKPSLRALQFTRSTPGVLAPLVGHKSEQHVEENLMIMNIPPFSEGEFELLVQKLTKPNN